MFLHSDLDTDVDALPLSSNLLTLLFQILTTSHDGNNGAYDLGIEDLGLNIPESLVDVAGIEQVRANLGDLLVQGLLVLGLDGEPLDVFEFFKEALLPYGVVICDKGGKLSVAELNDNDLMHPRSPKPPTSSGQRQHQRGRLPPGQGAWISRWTRSASHSKVFQALTLLLTR